MPDSLDLPEDAEDPPADLSADPSAEALAKEEALAREEDGPLPWDVEPPPDGADGADAPRQRHDAFTEAKKSVFLRALVKTGCILDACRLTGISPRTIYRHQESSPSFFDNCCAALRMAGTPAELTAWQRAVEGVEQEFACGGQVHVRRRYSDGLLRLLLQGSNPKKYGPRPGFTRKRVLRHERKQIEREVRAEIAAREKRWSFEEAIEALEPKLQAFGEREDQKKLAAGWTKSPDGHMLPPGYGWIGLPEGAGAPGEAVSEEGDAAAEAVSEEGDAAAGGDTPRDSM